MAQQHLSRAEIGKKKMTEAEAKKEFALEREVKGHLYERLRAIPFPVNKLHEGILNPNFSTWLKMALTYETSRSMDTDWHNHRIIISKSLDDKCNELTIHQMGCAINAIRNRNANELCPIVYYENIDTQITDFSLINDEMYRMRIVQVALEDSIKIDIEKELRSQSTILQPIKKILSLTD